MKYILIIITLIFLLTSCSGDKAAKAFERDKNIFVALTNGKEKQLTFNQSDVEPILVKDEDFVVFVRLMGNGHYRSIQKIMKVNIKDLAESVITEQKSFKDWSDSKELRRVNNLRLSLDKKWVLFVTDKYVTGSQLVKVNLETGEWVEMFTAESFDIIDKGEYRGYFLAGQSDIEGEMGRNIYYRLLNDSGRIIKKFSDEESMETFRNSLKNN